MHTKGPWTIGGELISKAGAATEIASVWSTRRERMAAPSQREADANARLISAAPEMLEALEQFISGYEAEGIDESIRDLFSWAYKLSRSAIRKAKGLD